MTRLINLSKIRPSNSCAILSLAVVPAHTDLVFYPDKTEKRPKPYQVSRSFLMKRTEQVDGPSRMARIQFMYTPFPAPWYAVVDALPLLGTSASIYDFDVKLLIMFTSRSSLVRSLSLSESVNMLPFFLAFLAELRMRQDRSWCTDASRRVQRCQL